MTISESTVTFFGRKVVDFVSGTPVSHTADTVYRLSSNEDSDLSLDDLLLEFLDSADKTKLEALVIGAWNDSFEDGPDGVLRVLIENAHALPALKALFVGDMTYEECEISWIIQTDYTPLLAAFPQLEALRVRGSTSLGLAAFSHASLRSLVIECGGLPAAIIGALAQSDLPALTHLELWVGTSEYGFDGDLDGLRAAVNKLRSPALKYLGLRDAEIADEIAVWLASEGWVSTLDTVDLSLGTLSDVGGAALADAAALAAVKRVDLSHHYLSAAVQERLRAALPGVVLDDAQEPDGEYRYVAVGE